MAWPQIGWRNRWKLRQSLITLGPGRIKHSVRVAENGSSSSGGHCLPTVLPELSLLAHQLIQAPHGRRTWPIKLPVETIHQLIRARRDWTPAGCGAGRVSKPKSLRMQTRVSPAGEKHSHDVGAAARQPGALRGRPCFQRGPGNVLEHLLHTASSRLFGVEKSRRRKHVILWEEGLHALRGSVNHLANAARFEERIKFWAIEFAVHQVRRERRNIPRHQRIFAPENHGAAALVQVARSLGQE